MRSFVAGNKTSLLTKSLRRYSGPQNKFVDDVHAAVDTWDEWDPGNPTEILLKNAVDSIGQS